MTLPTVSPSISPEPSGSGVGSKHDSPGRTLRRPTSESGWSSSEDTTTMRFRIKARPNGKYAIEYPCDGPDCGAPAPRPNKWHTLVAGCPDIESATTFLRTAWVGVTFDTPLTGSIPPQGVAA